MNRIRLRDEHLRALASGLGGPDLVRVLRRGQRSRRLLTLKLIVERASGLTVEHRQALDLLQAADEADHDGVAALVDAPMFGSWAGSTLRLVVGAGDAAAVERELDRLVPLAIVAAHRAGLPAELTGRAHRGGILLPGLGFLALEVAERTPVKVSCGRNRIWVDGFELPLADPLRSSAWQPLRVLDASGPPPVAVTLDDLDPHRDDYHIEASQRLPGATFDRWQRAFAATWQVIARHLPERAAELAAALQTVVPLRKPDLQAARSATSRDAVGAVGLDLPASTAEFAATLVHEVQHSKLTAAVDIEPLCAASDEAIYFAPWREDPRPIGGLLQGTYAFIGVADTWRALYEGSDRFPEAARQFANARADVSTAIPSLAGSGLLTPAGERFVDGMAAAVDRLRAVSLPRTLLADAETRVAAKRDAWRRHGGIAD